MDEIERIKQEVSIFELAEMYNAQPNNRGKCKHNPLRSEKTSSLQLYKSSNTYADFGDATSGSSTIDFYMNATGKSLSESIKELKGIAGISDMEYKPEPKKLAPIPEQDYMSSATIRKIFDQQIELDFKDKEHKKLLDEFAPKWIFQSADSADISYFISSVRKAKHEDTTMILLRDEHGHEQCLKYRFKMVGENLVKWCGLDGVKSNFLYTRLTENPLTIVTEGTSDFLVAVLMGYSVISLPSASYKGDIPFELTKDRELIFIGDDGEAGQSAIDRIMHETVCDKKKFNYESFRTKYNKQGTDFKDLILEYKTTEEFKANLLEYISTLDNEKGNDWLNTLKSKNKSVTRQTIKDTENMRMLIDGLLPHGQITTFVGQPNVGKSALTFAITNYLFENKHIQNLIYFDADNPLVYTKDRILKLMDKNGDENITFYTGSTASKDDMIQDLTLLTNFKDAGKDTLIVIDSLKNFINGSINDDKSINPMFDVLQQVRDVFGATVIVLHHTRKGKDDDGKLNYVGSQVIEASSDNMTYISKVEDTNILKLDNTKARALLTPVLSYAIDFDNMAFNPEELPPELPESNGVDLIVELLEAKGELDKREIKSFLKGKLTASKIEEIIKAHKNTMFKYKKNGNDWLIGLVNIEPKYKDAVSVTEFKMDMVDGLF